MLCSTLTAPAEYRLWIGCTVDDLKRHASDSIRDPGSRRTVREFVAAQRGRIVVEFLPGYAPELNPTEYIWVHLKQHELPNVCPGISGKLGRSARRALRRMGRRPSLVESFWKQAGLFDSCNM